MNPRVGKSVLTLSAEYALANKVDHPKTVYFREDSGRSA